MLFVILSLLLAGCNAFVPPVYSKKVWQAFQEKVLTQPYDRLDSDPYADKNLNTTMDANEVCAVVYEDDDRINYHLETFANEFEAIAVGAYITHKHGCGVCSTLQDLAAYMQHYDMTKDAKVCGIQGFLAKKLNMMCLAKIGFSLPCADIWYDNTVNTREFCGKLCMKYMFSPYNEEDGSLNPCLQCDEDHSGDVFKFIARRTRRDSGLGSTIWRPPDSVYPVYHYYY